MHWTHSIPLILLAAFSPAAFAQTPSVTGALNTASYIVPGLPNSGLAQGAMIAIFGSNLGPASIAQPAGFPLPTALGGTSVRFTVGGTTTNGILVYSLATQVGAIIPSATPVGAGTVTVTYNGATSAPLNIQIVKSAFGIFTLNQAGSGPAIAQVFKTQASQPVNTLVEAANPSSTITLWGTGLGPVSGNEAAGALPGDLGTDLEVLVGGKPATLRYRGRSGCCSAIDQIVFDVPSGVSGCYVPVSVRIGTIVSNATTMSIAASGSICSDPQLSPQDLQTAQSTGVFRSGSVVLGRVSVDVAIAGFTSTSKIDTGSGVFVRYTLQELLASQRFAGNTVGTCNSFNFNGSTGARTDPIQPVTLDAGSVINVNGPKGAKQLTRDALSGFYSANFATSSQIGGIPGLPPTVTGDPYLEPGTYNVDNGGGGANVGGFRATITVPSNFVWTNQAAVTNVVRASGQDVTWSGGNANDFVSISGFSFTPGTNPVGAGFTCLAPASAGRFTVPAAVLLALPPVTGGGPTPGGFFTVSYSSNPVRFTATGLDAAYLIFANSTTKSVNYQ